MTVGSKLSQSFANVYHWRQGTLKLFNPSIVLYMWFLITNISKAIVSFSDYVDSLKLGAYKK